ncbi:MAG: N-acetylmuramoyl-L-alanine amidase [Clostridiales bacterium]|nr:N-acetylmuramoyl-L-alanine amidase [Clostridiales bacterium]
MGSKLTEKEWIRRKSMKKASRIFLIIILMICIIGLSVFFIGGIFKDYLNKSKNTTEVLSSRLLNGIEVKQMYLTPNDYSRPQMPLKKVKGIVVHYTANPGTSAENNQSYFESLAEKGTTYASSHYIIGLEGEIVQCIPMTEISYASNDRNKDTISIENCHPDETGEFTSETYNSLVALTAALCVEYDLGEEDILSHYDITGKLCPLYFVEHEDAWKAFRREVMIKKALLNSKIDMIDNDFN